MAISIFAQNKGNISNKPSTICPIGAIRISYREFGIALQKINLTLYTDTTDYDGNGPSGVEEVRLNWNDGYEIENQQTEFPWFNSVFGHHYGSELICLEVTKNYYKILVGSSGVKYWIHKNNLLEFFTMDSYFKSFSGIRLPSKQAVRQNPDSNSPNVVINGNTENAVFAVKQVKNDWLEVNVTEDVDGEKYKTSKETGWIKWFSGNKLLLEIIDSF